MILRLIMNLAKRNLRGLSIIRKSRVHGRFWIYKIPYSISNDEKQPEIKFSSNLSTH